MNKYFYYLFFCCLTYAPISYGQDATNFEKAVLAALDSTNFYTQDEFFGISKYDSLGAEDQFLSLIHI